MGHQFRNLKSLRQLNLNGNQLKGFPKHAFSGLNLDLLEADNNYITDLEVSDLTDLSSIKYLSFRNNEIAVAENNVLKSNTNLRTLDLSGNSICKNKKLSNVLLCENCSIVC